MIKDKCCKFNNRKEVNNCLKNSKGISHKSGLGYMANEWVWIGTKFKSKKKDSFKLARSRELPVLSTKESWRLRLELFWNLWCCNWGKGKRRKSIIIAWGPMSNWQERTLTDKSHPLHWTLTATFHVSSCEDMCIPLILNQDLSTSKTWQYVSWENLWSVNWQENSVCRSAYVA